MPLAKKETSTQIRDLDIQYYEGDKNGGITQMEISKLLKILRSTIQESFENINCLEQLKTREEQRESQFLPREKRESS